MVAPPDSNDPFDDPFAPQDGASRTFIRPTPGGRGGTRAAPADHGRAVDAAADLPGTDHGLNPLLALANRLLLAVPQIRATRQLADPAELRNTLAHGLRQFGTDAAARQISPEQITAARYVLCTVLDEAASDTPWGGSGAWAGFSLLVMFHNENYGGEKVFRLMARLAEDPARNRDLLELIHAALSLGFEGRYRIIDNGAAQLEAVRDKLAQILRQQRGDHPAALAQHWQVPPQRRRRSLGWLPLLVAASVVALVLLVLHWGLASALGDQSDPVFAQIQGLRLAPTAAAATLPPRPVEPAAQLRLAQFLQPDIRSDRVAVRDEADRSIVTLRGDGLFAPGSTTLSGDAEALLARIGDALVQVKGAVLVTGHTDSQPIRSARFPSNWHLSDARARAVGELLLTRRVAPERLRTEGLADASPVAPNDTPANRALNRRVEITLLVAASVPSAAAPAGVPASGAASGSPL